MTIHHRITIAGPAPHGATASSARLEDHLGQSHDDELAAAHARGRAEGQADALAGAAASLSEAAEALDTCRKECTAEVACVAVELGIGIARRLVRTELAADRHDIEAIVREVLAATTERRTTTTIHVSPSDAERLTSVSFRAATEIIADESIATGSVRLETPLGVLVRDIDECMRNLAERLSAEVK